MIGLGLHPEALGPRIMFCYTNDLISLLFQLIFRLFLCALNFFVVSISATKALHPFVLKGLGTTSMNSY